MILKIRRTHKLQHYTIGELYVEGKFFCHTLEDTVRDLTKEPKIPGLTAIPPGIYLVKMTFSGRFQRILPELFNVPYFTFTRLHSGNRAVDTEGCPLLGKNEIKGGLVDSRLWSDRLNLILNYCEEDIVIIVE